MSTASSGVFAKRPRHMPGEEGIWIFILGDMLVFALFFSVFLYYRAENLPLFTASQTHLNQALGALNTVLMLSSSWFVATAVHAARRGMGRVTAVFFVLASICGAGFIVVKFFEYGSKIHAGITLTTNDFFMYYYMFTGIHLLHVIIGMGVLIFLARYTWGGSFDSTKIAHLETGSSFWHVVDLLWIVLFALLYLVK